MKPRISRPLASLTLLAPGRVARIATLVARGGQCVQLEGFADAGLRALVYQAIGGPAH